jgi:hypothetical protein
MEQNHYLHRGEFKTCYLLIRSSLELEGNYHRHGLHGGYCKAVRRAKQAFATYLGWMLDLVDIHTRYSSPRSQ